MSGPEIVTGLTDLSAKDGESLEMTCEFKGDPEPHGKVTLLKLFGKRSFTFWTPVAWFKNGEALVSSDVVSLKYKNRVATLTISEVFPEDEGAYECRATNSEGSKDTSCKLTIIRNHVSRFLCGQI